MVITFLKGLFFSSVFRYIIGGLLVAVLAFGGYKYWENQVEQKALIEWNNAQLEQVIKDQERFIKQLEALTLVQKQIIETTKAANAEIDEKVEEIQEYLGSDEALQSNRPSSDILKETIRRLDQ